jgi:hypothetical protein
MYATRDVTKRRLRVARSKLRHVDSDRDDCERHDDDNTQTHTQDRISRCNTSHDCGLV